MARPNWQNPLYEPVSVALGAFVTLTNVGASYDAISAARGLGFALIDFTNVARVEFIVQCNKIGTGTQSWQLWNETDSSQLAVIDDAGAAGNKVLSVVNNAPGLTGLKRVRVRALSTVAADDPLYYGACVLLS